MKLNHVLIRVTELAQASQFFTEVIGLTPGHRPAFPFRGAWFYSEGQPLIHVVEDRFENFDKSGPIAHVALEGSNYQRLLEKLQSFKIPFHEKDVPQSGERQVFVTGPNGLVVEMLFPIGMGSEHPQPYANAP